MDKIRQKYEKYYEPETVSYRAKCPYCGEEYRDSWELPQDGEHTCRKCEKTFYFETEVSREFFSFCIKSEPKQESADDFGIDTGFGSFLEE